MAKFNFYLGTAASSWLLVILVISAELFEPFKNLLKAVFTHHWIGKAVLTAVIFLVAGFAFGSKKLPWKVSDDKIAWHSVIGSLIIILLFFIMEFVK